MPRGHRFHLDGEVCHLTARCHRRQFLLKFARDRRTWVRWLYQSRQRYGLTVLNYQVTSNHVHLLVRDGGTGEIARSLQLVAGCTGRAYNCRQHRRGAFWDDFYHATVVDTDEHLARCFTYIDLNMVRAGVVEHPKDWPEAGYHEIQHPPQRYRIIDRKALGELLAVDEANVAAGQNEWIEARLAQGTLERDPQWSEVLAVGRRSFVERIKEQLGHRARYRRVEEGNGASVLREAAASYRHRSATGIGGLRRNFGLEADQS